MKAFEPLEAEDHRRPLGGDYAELGSTTISGTITVLSPIPQRARLGRELVCRSAGRDPWEAFRLLQACFEGSSGAAIDPIARHRRRLNGPRGLPSLPNGGRPKTGKTVVVLGGGVGGLVAAHELRRVLTRGHRVVLVERETRHVFQPSLLWLMVGQRTPGDLTRDLRRYRGNGVEVVRAEVTALDPTARTVETSAGALAADFLVLALGAELDPAGFPGLSQAGLTFYTAPGAVALRDHLARFGGGRVVILVSKIPFKCPAAPYEAALLIEAWMRRRGVREKVTVDLYTPEKLPMPVAGAAVGDALRELLAARGVGFHPEHALAAVDPASREVAFGNGATAFFDLLAYVPPHRAPAVVREAGLLNEAGWITVDPGTLETEHPGVYAIGDLAAARLRNGLFLPKAGVFAHAQALVVARNIAAQVAGRPPPARFDGRGYCWVEAGDGKAAFGSGDFYALPGPAIHLRGPSRLLHWGKVAFEKYWLWRWFGLRT